MALTTEKKLYIAVGVLAVMGGALYLQNKKTTEEAAAYTREGQAADLPTIGTTEEEAKKVDKIVINKPAEGDGGKPLEVVLVKKGEDDWELEKPIKYKANNSNVKSLIGNISKLKATEVIDSSPESYDKHGVSDAKALRAQFFQGDKALLDLYFGEGGGRGQMTRVAGKDGVFGVKGYSSFMYSRDLKGWRDLTIFKFEDKDVVEVEIKNDNGQFRFTKDGDKWAGKLKPPKSPVAKAIDKFKESKVGDLLRAYKTLNAAGFGDDQTLETAGLTEPDAVITIKLKEDKATYSLSIGEAAEGTNRWVKKNGSDQIFSVSSWAADWATGDSEKFQESDKKDAKPAPGGPPGGFQMPHGMPGGPG